MQDRGGGGGASSVTAEPARLTAFADDVAAGLARARAGADRCGDAVRAYRAAQPNDLGATTVDRTPAVRGDLRRLERIGRDLERFGGLLRALDVLDLGTVRIDGRVAQLLEDAPSLLTASPERIARWWDGLAPGERSRLVRGAPALIGNLDGVPFADRDRANRQNVRAHLRVLEVELAAAERRHADNTDGFWDTKWPFNRDIGSTAAAVVRLREQIEARRTWLARDDLTFIAYDAVGDGRAVVAIGDLATATRVAAVVPGITNTLANYHRMLRNADDLRDAMGRAGAPGPVATIAWLGYDTPDVPPDLSAAGPGRAREGAQALRTFTALLAGEAPRAEVTAIGHSYGSAVVGTAATGDLTVDRIALIGSPGGGASSVADYRLPPERVFAATTPDDPIRHVFTATAGLDGIALSHWNGFGPPPVDLETFGDRSPLGVNPVSEGFGATVFSTDGASGHSAYYDEGTESLRNLARIGAGMAPR